MNVTVVVDNVCGRNDLQCEYGLSVFLETPRGNLLFDTGQGDVVLENCRTLGVDLGAVDALVFSHGHYDHTWGYTSLALRGLDCPVWGHRRLGMPHHVVRSGKARYVGSCLPLESIDFRPVDEAGEILPDVWALPLLPDERNPDFEPRDSRLVVPAEDGSGWVPDRFEDDLSLVVRGRYGLSVLLGCAHAGAVNILEKAARLFGTRDFYTVQGGMHLNGQSAGKRTQLVGELLRRFSVECWRPGHCTGLEAAMEFVRQGVDVEWASAGSSVEI